MLILIGQPKPCADTIKQGSNVRADKKGKLVWNNKQLKRTASESHQASQQTSKANKYKEEINNSWRCVARPVVSVTLSARLINPPGDALR